MPITTPKYLITAPSPSSLHKNLGAELQQLAFDIERVLDGFDYEGADPSLVLARVAALETLTMQAAQVPARPWKQANATGTGGAITLKNSWINLMNANWNGLNLAVRNGIVHLTGAITKGSAYLELETIATLPADLAPEVSTMVPCSYARSGGYVIVRTSGDIITTSAGATGGQISLGGQLVPPLP